MLRSRLESAFLFVVSAMLACQVPGNAIFGTDQSGTLLSARAVLHGDLFVAGPEIGWSGFALGPLFNQVAAIAMAVRDDFADVIVLLSLVHAAGVVAFGHLFRRFVDPRVARLAAWALALHPLAMNTGATPISSSLVLPTAAVFLTGIARWSEERDPRGFGIACIGAALMVQAHITTLLLLPMFAIGFVRRAPVARPGRVGLAFAIVLAAPMLLFNLAALEDHSGGFRHAGGSGAPYALAVCRALMLELRLTEIPVDQGGFVHDFVRACAACWGVLTWAGAVAFLAKPEHTRFRWFVACALLVPTLAVPLLPRGALYYYLIATTPWRSMLVAYGITRILALARIDGARASTVLGAVILSAIAVPGAAYALTRGDAVIARGVILLNVGRVDLREPPGVGTQRVAILTLRSQRLLARGLERAGADPQTLLVHGPFRWVMTESTRYHMHGARMRTRDTPIDERTHDAFLVLHEDDRVPAPTGPTVRAGPFRIHRFRSLASATERDDGTVRVDLARGAATLQIVASMEPKFEAHGPTLDAAETIAGFPTYSASVGEAGAASFVFRFGTPSASSPLVRLPVDVYAFAAPPTP